MNNAIRLNLTTSHQDRYGNPLYPNTVSRYEERIISGQTIEINTEVAQETAFNSCFIDQGLLVADVLFYNSNPNVVCFKLADGSFTQIALSTTPQTLSTSVRYKINTNNEILWCYEIREYKITLSSPAFISASSDSEHYVGETQ